MKIGENKKISFLTFNKVDAEILEQYLNEMIKEGWLLKKIKNYHLTFEKTDKRNLKYNVDPVGRDFYGDNYSNEITYIEYCRELGWEYICGNDIFKICISEDNNKEKIKSKPAESIKSLVITDVIYLVAFILLANYIFKDKDYYMGSSYMEFISSYIGVSFYIFGMLVLICLAIFLFLRIIWYLNYFVKKRFRHRNLREIKIISVFSVGYFYMLMTLLILNLAITLFDGFGISPRVSHSKKSLPIALEDYHIKIQSERDSESTIYKSFLAKYYSFYDTTHYYDDNLGEENSEGYLFYEVFESKYESIINNALRNIKKNDIISGNQYKKYTSGKEFDDWGANEIYIDTSSNERIIVYDNIIFILKFMEDDYNEKNIDFIKSKLMNL